MQRQTLTFKSYGLILALGICGCGQQGVRATDVPTPAPSATTTAPTTPPTDIDPELLFSLLAGEIAGQRGQIEAAKRFYLDAATEAQSPIIASRAARIALFNRDLATATEAAELWAKLAPEDAEARQMLVQLYLKQRQFDLAFWQLRKLASLQGQENDGAAFMVLAALLADEENRPDALPLMEGLVQKAGGSAEGYYAYAWLAWRLEAYPKAQQAVTQALALKSDAIPALVLRAQIEFDRGEVETGLQQLEQLTEQYANDPVPRLAYAKLLVEAKRYEKALGQFERALQAAPQNLDIVYALALLNLQMKQYEAAKTHLQTLISDSERGPEALYYLGQVAQRQQRWEEAVQWFQQVPDGEYWLEAQSHIASAWMRAGKRSEARGLVQSLRLRLPQYQSRLYLLEGELLSDAKDYQGALEVYNQALEVLSDDKDLLYARGLLAEKLDRIDWMERDLRAALKLDPENPALLNALGYTLTDRTERHQEALGYIQRALTLKPDDPSILDSMGWVQYRLGHFNEAARYLRRALELLPDAEIAAHLGEVLWVLGEQQEAQKIWDQGLQQEADNEVLLKTLRRYSKPPH